MATRVAISNDRMPGNLHQFVGGMLRKGEVQLEGKCDVDVAFVMVGDLKISMSRWAVLIEKGLGGKVRAGETVMAG